MSYLLNNQQKLTEIVFENRNKNYGAYVIRSAYGETVLKALSIMASFVAIVLTSAYFLTEAAATSPIINIQIPDIIYSTTVDLKKQIPEAPARRRSEPSPPRQNSEAGATSNVISDTSEVTSENTTTLFGGHVTSLDTDNGTGDGKTGTGTAELETGTSDKTVAVIKDSYEVDKLPEFEGGLNALYRFVAVNSRFTEDARDAGQGGRVCVRFIVDEEGKIGSLTLLNKLGYGLDEEALRVIGILPKFKSPAMVKGKPVKMYYQIPINFKLK